jgi:hypothetical protein
MLEQKVDIFIMAGKRKQLSNDIKNVIVEMRKNAAILDFAGKLWNSTLYVFLQQF